MPTFQEEMLFLQHKLVGLKRKNAFPQKTKLMTFQLRTMLLCALVATCSLMPSETFAQRKQKANTDGLPLPVANSQPDIPALEAPHDAPTGHSNLVSIVDEISTNTIGRGNINSLYTEGIDISHYQERIDWDQVCKEPISYVYIKATEGCNFIDNHYATNISEAHRVGLSVGSYHFYRPNVDWQQQLAHMTNIVKAEEQDLVPLIDVEVRGHVSEGKFITDLKNFIAAVEKHYGKRPLIYSGQNFYNKHLAGHFPQHQFMIARYNTSQQPLLSDGKSYIMWQYSDRGRVPGIRTNVDRSRILGDFSLRELKM